MPQIKTAVASILTTPKKLDQLKCEIARTLYGISRLMVWGDLYTYSTEKGEFYNPSSP